MRNTNIALILIIAFLALNSGCKKDDDGIQSPGQFNYDGTTYKLSQGFLLGKGELPNNRFRIDVLLMSSGLTLIEKNGYVDTIIGIGDVISIPFSSSHYNQLDPDGYTYNPSGSSGTFSKGIIYIQYNQQENEVLIYDVINGGDIMVNKNDETYQLSLDVNAYSGGLVKGDYIGKLKYYDYIVDTISQIRESK
ncbi:MAG: hypothetical protein L3J66_13970 [Bacteroidales bacterium]|nr:hypothetical protein [Bacteroidales bacterium]